MKLIRLFIYFVLLVLVIIIIIIHGLNISSPGRLQVKHCNSKVHLGTVLIGFSSTYNFYTSLKSILSNRNGALHFHIISDDVSRKNLVMMFEKWKIPEVTVDYYDIKILPFIQEIKLSFLDIIDSSVTNKIIVFDADVIFNYNVKEIWNLFENFHGNQVIGLLDIGENNIQIKSFETDLILYHMKYLTKARKEILETLLSDMVPIESSKAAFNVIATMYPEFVYNITSDLKSNFKRNINMQTITHYDGTLQRAAFQRSSNKCSDFEDSIAYSWRILPHIRTFEPDPSANITLVSQLTYDRIYMLKTLSSRWRGPMSFVLYVTDAELVKSLDLIENTASLANRSNIAYHVVFKEANLLHPINLCRNIAWNYSVTPFVLIIDADFIFGQDLDVVLEQHLVEQKNMNKKVLVVPAFQANGKLSSGYPKTKKEALKLFNKGKIFQVSLKVYKMGHAPTNYKLWKTASKPYKINWKPGYEPYIVVDHNTVKFDERFVGYALDKISHITLLNFLGYEFIGLPNTFAIHKDHPKSIYSKAFRTKRFQKCLYQVVADKVEEELHTLCQCDLKLW